MGCFASRFDRRNTATNDFNAITTAFLGGKDSELFDNFPVDRVLGNLAGDAEPADFVKVEDDLKLADETQTTEFYNATLKFLTAEHETLNSKHGAAADAKAVTLFDKYDAATVVSGLNDTITFLKENSGIKGEEPAAAEGEKKEEAAAAEGEDMMNEGGDEGEEKKDEMMAMGDAAAEMEGSMQKPNPFTYDKDERKYDGWNNVAAALLRNMLVNPVFGDMMRANALSWEFNKDKTNNFSELNQACALVSAAAAKAVTGENNLFISGYLDNDSFEALGDLVTDKAPIHFPFVTAGWGSKDEALNAFDHTPISDKKKDDYKKVLFEVTGAASFQFAGCRQIVHRLNGSIEGPAEADGVHTFKVAANKIEAQTVADWKKAQEAAPVVAAAETPEEEKKDDMAEEKKDDAPAEMMEGA